MSSTAIDLQVTKYKNITVVVTTKSVRYHIKFIIMVSKFVHFSNQICNTQHLHICALSCHVCLALSLSLCLSVCHPSVHSHTHSLSHSLTLSLCLSMSPLSIGMILITTPLVPPTLVQCVPIRRRLEHSGTMSLTLVENLVFVFGRDTLLM